MKKKLPVALVAIVVITAVMSATAFASSAQSIVDTANAQIQQEITRAIAQANQATAVYDASVQALQGCGGPQAASLLALCNTLYDARLDQIASSLVMKTDMIAGKAIADAAALGVTVVCRYEPVTLGDRVVLVDPLVVVSD